MHGSPPALASWRNTSLESEINRLWIYKVKKKEFSRTPARGLKVVGVKMPVTEREDGEVLVLRDRWRVLFWICLRATWGHHVKKADIRG